MVDLLASEKTIMVTVSGVSVVRGLPIGAELTREGTNFRVWAPRRSKVDLVIEGGASTPLGRDGQGYFSGTVSNAGAGTLYRYRLDGDQYLYPDPVSRFQPQGPHGPSEVIDPAVFQWSDEHWSGLQLKGQVLYELHIGTFTREGTYEAAMRELPQLASLGITAVEILPVAEFDGKFGWGYDGVDLFAPTRLYGRPDDLRAFVNRAHELGLGVILDVVYNHFGPSGNYLKQFSEDYFTDRHANEWGEALNFDGNNAAQARELYVSNAAYWIKEFHFDGLRLDATHQIFDDSSNHVLAEIGRSARQAAGHRSILIFAENDYQCSRCARPVERGGYGLDGVWNDDFHHSARVAATGHNEGYYKDFHGSPQEFISALKYGYLYQGQWFSNWQKGRGEPGRDLRQPAFVAYLENHDQVAHSADGRRLHQLTSPGRFRALTALLLLGPNTPMLFQGEEFSSSKPFLYFADHEPELAKLVRKGRAEFLSQFPSVATPEAQSRLHDPSDPHAFDACKLDLSERESHRQAYDLHRDLLRLRREDSTISLQGENGLDGAVLTSEAFVIRYFGNDIREGFDDRLLIVNLGRDVWLRSPSEPLLASPMNARWEIFWSSEDPKYDGRGMPAVDTNDGWRIHGESAVLLKPTSQAREEKNG